MEVAVVAEPAIQQFVAKAVLQGALLACRAVGSAHASRSHKADLVGAPRIAFRRPAWANHAQKVGFSGVAVSGRLSVDQSTYSRAGNALEVLSSARSRDALNTSQ
jgi:hypothetical protein